MVIVGGILAGVGRYRPDRGSKSLRKDMAKLDRILALIPMFRFDE